MSMLEMNCVELVAFLGNWLHMRMSLKRVETTGGYAFVEIESLGYAFGRHHRVVDGRMT